MARDLDEKISYIQEKVEEVSSTVHKIDKEVALQKAAFDEHMRQDEKMYEEFKRMNDILQVNTESLREHMHRTEVAEQQLAILEDLAKNVDIRLAPIERERLEKAAVSKYRSELLMKVAKVLGIVGTVIAIIAGIKAI